MGTFLEGEIFLLVVGFFIKLKLLNPYVSLVSAMAGAFFHEMIYFLLGKWKGREFLLRNRHTRKEYRRAKKLLHRYGILSIFIIRFLYGMRMIPMMLMGATGFSPVKFILFNLISLFFWAVIYLSIGFFFGKAAEHFFGEAKEYYFAFIGLVIVILLLLLVYPKILEKIRKQ
ncbi:DedA family protein [Persephonella atlantica]|uniref:DedA family protein n=1 Tax=Persephonella atlantica TaxID=2699429 RepID=UPI0030841896